MDRRRFLELGLACGGVAIAHTLCAEQAGAANFHCGSPTLSPYGPIAECKYSMERGLDEPAIFGGNVWATALCFVLRARGFHMLGKRIAGAINAGETGTAEEVLQWASSRWRQDDGKNFKIEAQFFPLSEFSSWVSPASFPVLVRIDGKPNVLVSADLRCNRQSQLCDYVDGTVYDFETGEGRQLSLDDWKLTTEFVRLDVLSDAPFDDAEVQAGNS